jgi:hypothetical protein
VTSGIHIQECQEMKNQYIAPKLHAYGSVDSLTQVFGSVPTKDTFIINGLAEDVDGSGSVVITR